MKAAHSKRPVRYLVGVFFVGMVITAPRAEDIEVYTRSTGDLTRPNIVIIADTSGSMADPIGTYSSAYDPAFSYPGDCVNDFIYWSDAGLPDCTIPTQSRRHFESAVNTCKRTPLDRTGQAVGGVYAQRQGNYWVPLSPAASPTALLGNKIECAADAGVHGESSGAPEVYAAAQGSPNGWTANVSAAYGWSAYTIANLYQGNYLNWRVINNSAPPAQTIKIDVLKTVFNNLIDSTSGINMAIMRFDGNGNNGKGGYFVSPMLEVDTNRPALKSAVNALTAAGATPLSEALYESYLFYRGDNLFESAIHPNDPGVLDPGDPSKFLSPITNPCQKNFVILLTDGVPNRDNSANTLIPALPNFASLTGSSSCTDADDTLVGSSYRGICLNDLAHYMNAADCRSDLAGAQQVITYTVGFSVDFAALDSTARRGGGKYFTASTGPALSDSLNEILLDLRSVNDTFTAPAVSVNAFNRLTHRSELYYALFRPNLRPAWEGNVKKYKLAQLAGRASPDILDKDDQEAIDPATGFFKETATSYWTDSADGPDGNDVRKSGVAGQVTLTRKVYTYTGSAAPDDVDLTLPAHKLHESNTAITRALLDATKVPNDARRTEVLQRTRGLDVLDEDSDSDNTDARQLLGDPLHTKPLLITFGGTDANPDLTLFFSTNEGYLHAVDVDDGSELWAFMPQELLKIQADLYDNTNVNRSYGLDGPLTHWFNDVNDNGVLLDSTDNLEAGEFIYLYVGMRRGGRNYYSLDVTDRDKPELRWRIKGGEGEFKELGQTWSEPTLGKVTINGVDKNVLFFGGGYDKDQDDNLRWAADDVGRAIFMVDADTGDKLWQAGPAGTDDASSNDPNLVLDMNNSIPSDLLVLDIDNDGYTDRIYVADMGGVLWRVDFSTNNTGADDLASGGVLIHLGALRYGVLAAPYINFDNLRFYYPPDASLSVSGDHINLAIGSGWRAHPLDRSKSDTFFVIRDPNVNGPERDTHSNPIYTPLDPNDIYDATNNLILEGNSTQRALAEQDLATSVGFQNHFKLGIP